jgi:serine/threonine protein kinase
MKGVISESVAAILTRIIQAIDYLDKKRIVHHDINPMNLLLTKDENQNFQMFI